MAEVEKIPYFDLTGQFDSLKSEWFDEIGQLGKTGNFILGPAIERFESSIAEYLGVEHAVSVSSGTDALILALQALGIGPGDSVVIPGLYLLCDSRSRFADRSRACICGH